MGKKKPVEPPDELKLTQYEKYTIVLMKRSDIKFASYNPRKLDPEQRKRLMGNLKKRGLMEPPIFNSGTGNLVGGHQRLKILDDLHGGRDYTLHVAVVTLTEEEEKAQNIFLNNPAAQGYYDMPALEQMFKDGVSFEDAGFSSGDIHEMFGDSILLDQPAEDLAAMAERIRAAQELMDKVIAVEKDRDDQDYYNVIVHKNDQARVNFTHFARLPDARFSDGLAIHTKLKEAADLVKKFCECIPPSAGLKEAKQEAKQWLADNFDFTDPPSVIYGKDDGDGKEKDGQKGKAGDQEAGAAEQEKTDAVQDGGEGAAAEAEEVVAAPAAKPARKRKRAGK